MKRIMFTVVSLDLVVEQRRWSRCLCGGHSVVVVVVHIVLRVAHAVAMIVSSTLRELAVAAQHDGHVAQDRVARGGVHG